MGLLIEWITNSPNHCNENCLAVVRRFDNEILGVKGLTPKISQVILHTVSHAVLVMLVWRI